MECESTLSLGTGLPYPSMSNLRRGFLYPGVAVMCKGRADFIVEETVDLAATDSYAFEVLL